MKKLTTADRVVLGRISYLIEVHFLYADQKALETA